MEIPTPSINRAVTVEQGNRIVAGVACEIKGRFFGLVLFNMGMATAFFM